MVCPWQKSSEHMDILRFLLVLFALFWVICARNECPASECGDKNFSIRFPFKLEQQSENCGYPGFDLSCNRQGMAILSLPYSGDFYVRDINYLTQEIQLYDPHGCLPSRLLNLNLSSSPFAATYYRNYTFLSCSPELVMSKFSDIDCLSNSTTSILAISSFSPAGPMNMCTVLFNLAIPVSWQQQNDDGFSAELNGDLMLSWNLPSCADCETKGDFCRFEDRTSQEISCYDPDTGGSDVLRVFKILAATLVVPAISCIMAICCIICLVNRTLRRENGSATAAVAPQPTAAVAPQPTSAAAGLDDSTIETYKKVVLGESRRLPGPNDNTCPICLTDYIPREAIRCIPDCQHCFHADCIDEWLRMTGSCPVCRCSPIPTTLNSRQVATFELQDSL